MIKAVLLDLDNTLLKNPDMPFAQAFLELFDQHYQLAGINNAPANFRQAIQVMGSGQKGQKSNRSQILELLGGSEELFKQFYEQLYPLLKDLISPIEGAAALIHKLRAMNLAVIIATNPIYPETAIRQRMAWAGLPLEENIYSLVTSADNMHFAKPDPAYYAEILARVGIEPDEAIMVGDSFRSDIAPAKEAGLRTFQVGEKAILDFADVMQACFDDSQTILLQPEMIEPQLRGNIGALYGMLATVQEKFWHQRPDPKEWSIIQILCHLRDFEGQVERYRLLRILQEENPFITQPQEPGPNIPACDDDGYEIAAEFVREREATLELIQGFSAETWQRRTRHSIFGLSTMLEMAYFTAQHDRLHLNQLCQTIGRCQ
jgi:FMN phosphatase YigB (HAD superfamily)